MGGAEGEARACLAAGCTGTLPVHQGQQLSRSSAVPPVRVNLQWMLMGFQWHERIYSLLLRCLSMGRRPLHTSLVRQLTKVDVRH